MFYVSRDGTVTLGSRSVRTGTLMPESFPAVSRRGKADVTRFAVSWAGVPSWAAITGQTIPNVATFRRYSAYCPDHGLVGKSLSFAHIQDIVHEHDIERSHND